MSRYQRFMTFLEITMTKFNYLKGIFLSFVHNVGKRALTFMNYTTWS